MRAARQTLSVLPASASRMSAVALALTATLTTVLVSRAGPACADPGALAGLPLPPEAESRAISTDVMQNGLSTSIASFGTSATIERTLAFYRDVWPASEDDPGHAEARLGDWSVISRVEGDALLVVQLRDGAPGAVGLLSAVSRTRDVGVALPPPPMPAGGQLLSSLSTRDAGSVAVTSVVSSSARPGEVAAFYRDDLVRDGWRIVSDRIDDGASVLLFDRRGSRLELVVADVDGQSIAVLNEVRIDD